MENINEEVVQPTTQELINEAQARVLEARGELDRLGYLTSKEADGEDMRQYGDWKSYRKGLREEVRKQEEEVVRLRDVLKQEESLMSERYQYFK